MSQKNKVSLQKALQAIQKCLPKRKAAIPLHEPRFIGNELNYVKNCLRSGIVSSIGPYVDRFEKKLIELTGSPSAVATINGTAALHISLKAVGVEPGDEVLVPSLSFIATANAITYCGASPHFLDSDLRAFGLNAFDLEKYLRKATSFRGGSCYNRKTRRKIKALIAVHTFGHPVDLDPIKEVCQIFKLKLIEDAAESIGSYYKNRHTGTIGDLGVLSFNGNKTITTGGGGAILVQNQKLAKHLRHITTTAKKPHPWRYFHDQIGYNYRLPNLNAALGCAQLELLSEFVNRKRALAKRYENAFANVPGVRFISEPPFAKSNYWLNSIMLTGAGLREREAFLDLTHRHNIKTRPVWTLTHRLPMFKQCPRMDLPNAEIIEKETINLPSSPSL